MATNEATYQSELAARSSLGLSEILEANRVTVYALSDTPQSQQDSP
jgi:hypothetical protein